MSMSKLASRAALCYNGDLKYRGSEGAVNTFRLVTHLLWRQVTMDSLSPHGFFQQELPLFDSHTYYLGSLCKNKHTWLGTEQSLRFWSTRKCVQCTKGARTRYRQSEHGKAHEETYWQSEHGQEVMRRGRDRYAQSEHGKATIQQGIQKRWLSGRTALATQRYHHTPRGRMKKRIREHIRRVRIRDVHEPYSVEQVQAVFQAFGNACAYCGSQDRVTIDHFVPLMKNGVDAIWNIIPACLSCNSSKSVMQAETWYRSRPFFSEERWQIILTYLMNERQG